MSTRCPEGHTSSDPSFCDVCGIEMTPAAEPTPGAAGGEITCEACSEVNRAGNVFCEVCGYDFATGTLPEELASAEGAPGSLGFAITVTHDASRSASAIQSGLTPPDPPPPPLRLPASGTITLGRDADNDVIFGSGSHADPGVSGSHLKLECGVDGVVHATDLGSTNGSRVSGAPIDMPSGEPVPLDPDAVVLLGAWTRIEVHAEPAVDPATPAAEPAGVSAEPAAEPEGAASGDQTSAE